MDIEWQKRKAKCHTSTVYVTIIIQLNKFIMNVILLFNNLTYWPIINSTSDIMILGY
jgi:hypothetical protein